MPDVEHGHNDVEGLARKLRDLESQLTAPERRLLKRILAAAVLSGIVVGPVTRAVDPAGADTPAAQAAEGIDGIRAQFAAAFTPGEQWSTSLSDIGLVI